MARIIPADGPTNANPRILVVGERPGFDENQDGQNFVGRAGQELWARLSRETGLRRVNLRVANLVPTFSVNPPTAEEVAEYEHLLRAEIRLVRPKFILTIGYHAARYFLPQFADVNGDYFHGLAFPYTYGKVIIRTATVVPLVHSSAALRQPDRYQNQLTEDCQAVGRVLAGTQPLHRVRPQQAFRIGLAGFGRAGQILGCDTEGSLAHPEAVTLANEQDKRCAALVEVYDKAPSPFLAAAVHLASRLYIHYAVHDWNVLRRLGIDLASADCTMLMASLLGLPQGLKVLAFRELHIQMQEYVDLVGPLDESVVKSALEAAYGQGQKQIEQDEWDRQRAKYKARRHTRRQGRSNPRAAQTHPQRRDRGRAVRHRSAQHGHAGHGAVRHSGRAADRTVQGAQREAAQNGQDGPDSQHQDRSGSAPLWSKRALTSIRSILTRPAEESPRRRWEKSAYTGLVPLPSAPTWKDLPQAVREPYACGDAIAHRNLGQLLERRIKAIPGLWECYRLDRSVLPILARSEWIGMQCDAKELGKLSRIFQTDFERIGTEIDALAGYHVNPLSGDQVSDCLFDQLGIRPTRLTKGRSHYTTADKYLKARRNEHQIIPLILESRQLNKYRGTYVDKLPGLLRDGRYHPEWKYTRTSSGRLAETIILLIPKHDPLAKSQHRMNRAKAIRNCFHAADGRTLVSVDLSQIEMRVMAHMSQDEVLLEFFRSGQDIHAQTAERLLGAPRGKENQDESAHRLPAKTVNFGIINGMTEFGMLDQLHEAGQLQWTIEQVQELLREWFKLHKGVDHWWNGQVAFCRRTGYVQDMFGRRRFIGAIHSQDERIRKEAERQTLMPIQAGADGISKKWNSRLWHHVILPRIKEGRRYCEPWVRVHDDTTLECDSRIRRTVQAEMLQCIPQLLCVPTLAEGKQGQQWGDLH